MWIEVTDSFLTIHIWIVFCIRQRAMQLPWVWIMTREPKRRKNVQSSTLFNLKSMKHRAQVITLLVRHQAKRVNRCERVGIAKKKTANKTTTIPFSYKYSVKVIEFYGKYFCIRSSSNYLTLFLTGCYSSWLRSAHTTSYVL